MMFLLLGPQLPWLEIEYTRYRSHAKSCPHYENTKMSQLQGERHSGG